jgi:hypothetical protein
MDMSWPAQNCHPRGAKLPAKRTIDPKKGSFIDELGFVESAFWSALHGGMGRASGKERNACIV